MIGEFGVQERKSGEKAQWLKEVRLEQILEALAVPFTLEED